MLGLTAIPTSPFTFYISTRTHTFRSFQRRTKNRLKQAKNPITSTATNFSSLSTYYRANFCLLFMPERSLRRRLPASGSRKSRPPHPSPSPSRKTPPPRRSVKHPRPIKILKRSLSEPMLWSCSESGGISEAEVQRQRGLWSTGESSGVLPRPHTFTDGFASSPSLMNFSPRSFEVRSFVLV